MKESLITILKLCGIAALLAVVIGIIVVIIGNVNGWKTALEYSNAFFIAGFFVIAGGLASRLGANQDANQARLSSSAEGMRDKSMSERIGTIANARGSTNLVIICILSGVYLMLVSELVAKVF